MEFFRGILSSVNKYWTDVGEPDTEASLASALYRAVIVLTESKGGQCELEIAEHSAARLGHEVRFHYLRR